LHIGAYLIAAHGIGEHCQHQALYRLQSFVLCSGLRKTVTAESILVQTVIPSNHYALSSTFLKQHQRCAIDLSISRQSKRVGPVVGVAIEQQSWHDR
jgi:hypothetical protein